MTTITRGVPIRSAGEKSRPASIGMPGASRYPGETILANAMRSCGEAADGRSAAPIGGSPHGSSTGTWLAMLTAVTPGTAASSSTSPC